ncbi:hybrid sensor histidine kinase/response regulator [Pelagicoccus sp. SDUM812003]|uniref:hybrid sensor histidine kinase/response regulator n=1 Tax=Pelagicoccus sp. SDUM812003 TaxID=3041267 RepID=UPI00280DABFA|nr:hybrid sensor histidine kinase/response regulator [Pelagicoccus sp. SDUM812003]MDQ8203578.1 hybrid sensor histidine kinase/response regulator [Pelagicoccus sp. SDUM812003]
MTDTKKRILLIDDDPSVCSALLMLLKDEFDAHAAGTVREGVELFDSLNPNVVVLDLHLPDQHGLDALRSIRRMNRSAPVVILTGYATLEAVEESMRLGASDCLHKPFDALALRSRLRELSNLDDVLGPEVEESSAAYGRLEPSDDSLVASSFLHDIGNPLTSLSAISAMMQECVGDAQKCARLAEMIDKNVEYASSLIEQWRAFAEPENLRGDYASAEEIAQWAIGLVRLRAEAKKVELLLEVQSPLVSPRLNRYATIRILVNLLQNAIEAVPREAGWVRFRAGERDGMVEFSVSDNGAGIDPAVGQKIFQPRYTTKKKGTGLGLFIARRIVDSARGSISLCSRPGRGTTFTVQLPAI